MICLVNFLTFKCGVDCTPHQSAYGMQRKISNLCMNLSLLYRESLVRVSRTIVVKPTGPVYL